MSLPIFSFFKILLSFFASGSLHVLLNFFIKILLQLKRFPVPRALIIFILFCVAYLINATFALISSQASMI